MAQELNQIEIDAMEVDHRRPPESEFNESQVESPTLDIKVYESYTGLARLHRLIYIADQHPSLRMKALKIAIEYAISSHDVGTYKLLHTKIANGNDGFPDDASQSNVKDMPLYDPMWVETRTKDAAQKLDQLNNDLENQKSNSINEGIRRGHINLGDHYLSCGDLPNALRCYLQGLDYCTSGNDTVNMYLNVIKVSIFLGAWSNVSIYVAKAVAILRSSEGNSKDVNQLTKLKCAGGLAYLATKDYKAAAEHFVQASFEHCEFPDMISPNNVAMYGGLCALASFNRQEMQRHVISSSSFKLFLELEPQLLDIILKFYELQFDPCEKFLDEIRGNLLVDMYIAQHVNALYAKIQSRTEKLFEDESAEPEKIRLFIVGSNNTTFYGSVSVSPLNTVRKLKQRIEQMTFILTKSQALMHRGFNLIDSDVLKLVGIKGFDAIVLQGIPDNEGTQSKSMPSTSKKTDRKRQIDNEEESSNPSPSERSRHTNESSSESSGITCDGKSTESTGFSAGFSELENIGLQPYPVRAYRQNKNVQTKMISASISKKRKMFLTESVRSLFICRDCSFGRVKTSDCLLVCIGSAIY